MIEVIITLILTKPHNIISLTEGFVEIERDQ